VPPSQSVGAWSKLRTFAGTATSVYDPCLPRHQIHDGPRKAAIDDDLVAIDVGRAVARQEQDGIRHVLRRADAAHRHHSRPRSVTPGVS
jgi:hypothetical protein